MKVILACYPQTLFISICPLSATISFCHSSQAELMIIVCGGHFSSEDTFCHLVSIVRLCRSCWFQTQAHNKPGFIMWFFFRGRIGSWFGTTLLPTHSLQLKHNDFRHLVISNSHSTLWKFWCKFSTDLGLVLTLTLSGNMKKMVLSLEWSL